MIFMVMVFSCCKFSNILTNNVLICEGRVKNNEGRKLKVVEVNV